MDSIPFAYDSSYVTCYYLFTGGEVMKQCTDKEYELIQLLKTRKLKFKGESALTIQILIHQIRSGIDPELDELDRIKKMIESSIVDTETMKIFNRRTYVKD